MNQEMQTPETSDGPRALAQLQFARSLRQLRGAEHHLNTLRNRLPPWTDLPPYLTKAFTMLEASRACIRAAQAALSTQTDRG